MSNSTSKSTRRPHHKDGRSISDARPAGMSVKLVVRRPTPSYTPRPVTRPRLSPMPSRLTDVSKTQSLVIKSLPPALPAGLRLCRGRGTCFFATLEHCKLLVEPRNQLANSCLCKSVLTNRMILLQSLEPLLQLSQLQLGFLILDFCGYHSSTSTRPFRLPSASRVRLTYCTQSSQSRWVPAA